MKRWFVCPDGEQQEITECLAGNCRMNERCAPLAVLRDLGKPRRWHNRVGVTDLLSGAREVFLRYTTDYAEDVDDSMFMIDGRRRHAQLEDAGDDTEEFMEMDQIAGIRDLVETQSNGENWLVDYKVTGSFKVKKILGLQGRKEPLLDEFGEPKMWRGKARTKMVWGSNGVNQSELWEWTTQVNLYRIMEEVLNKREIHRMKIFVIVRDGGTFSAKNNGVFRRSNYVDVPLMDNDKLLKWARGRRDAVLEAMQSGVVPPLCGDRETWDGRKCKDYCSVRVPCRELHEKESEDAFTEGETVQDPEGRPGGTVRDDSRDSEEGDESAIG